MGVWRPFRGPFERWPQLTDLLIALVAFVLTLAMWSQRAEDQSPTMDTFTDAATTMACTCHG